MLIKRGCRYILPNCYLNTICHSLLISFQQIRELQVGEFPLVVQPEISPILKLYRPVCSRSKYLALTALLSGQHKPRSTNNAVP